MARKTTRITITEEGRDKNKNFILTELPADQAERWAIRAMLGMAQSGADISPEVMAGGMASLAAMGMQALLGARWEILEPLLDEMWECVAFEITRGAPLQNIFPGLNSQIEEVKTRFALRMAVLGLHMDFFIPGASPTSDQVQGENEAPPTRTFLGSLRSWYQTALRPS